LVLKLNRDSCYGKTKALAALVIIAVCLLTLYNILPTIIFYSKPLEETIDAAMQKVLPLRYRTG